MTSHPEQMDPSLPLKNKVAIVTGAGRPRGIGRMSALKLAELGAHVVVTDIGKKRQELVVSGEECSLGIGDDFNQLAGLSQEIEKFGVKSLALAVDVTDAAQIDACVKKTCSTLGGVDILVNNAGTAVGIGPFLEIRADQLDLAYQVNLKGMLTFCQLIIPQMKRRGGGSIINMSSQAGLGALPGYGAYTVTKFSVVGLTKLIAAEFGPDNIRCNAVCPGIIDTMMNDYQIQFTAARGGMTEDEATVVMVNDVAMQRFGLPEEVADTVAWLAGPAAGYVTGETIQVAGGLPAGL
ncbi:MAG: SDR family oxidoreductase [Deltaproteobacteria bacterium]|nr:SDR family oxidoreductase [Deltaproteobacteria bacterium]